MTAPVDPPCPAGYTQATMPPNPANPSSILCTNGVDEVVKVGTKGSAFWIDRYESSLWTAADGPTSGMPQFGMADDSSTTFPKNGQVTTPLYALSITGVMPARYVTWFQANEACAASGKRLALGDEWLRAARGTTDPGANDGTAAGNTMCNTQSSGVRTTGLGLGATPPMSCVSDWGVQDMIANVGEWTAEWNSSVGDQLSHLAWPSPDYNDDHTVSVTSTAFDGVSNVLGMPSVGVRGGSSFDATAAGIFALDFNRGPSAWDALVGFRCVVPR